MLRMSSDSEPALAGAYRLAPPRLQLRKVEAIMQKVPNIMALRFELREDALPRCKLSMRDLRDHHGDNATARYSSSCWFRASMPWAERRSNPVPHSPFRSSLAFDPFFSLSFVPPEPLM